MFVATYKSEGEWVSFSLTTSTCIDEAFATARTIVGERVGLSVARIEENVDLQQIVGIVS